MAEWRQSCCNPFNKVHHTVRKKSQLRVVTKKMCKKVPSILPGEKICHTCRKQVSAVSEPTEQEQSQSRPFIVEQPSPSDQEYAEIARAQSRTHYYRLVLRIRFFSHQAVPHHSCHKITNQSQQIPDNSWRNSNYKKKTAE